MAQDWIILLPRKMSSMNRICPLLTSWAYVGVVIGAALNTKKYPFHHVKKLCELLDHPIVLLGGLEDADEGDRIAASRQDKDL